MARHLTDAGLSFVDTADASAGGSTTSDSEVFSDYEHGNFALTVTGNSTAGTGQATSGTGKYIRTGIMVSFNIITNITNAGTCAGVVLWAGLPYAAVFNNHEEFSVSMSDFNQSNSGAYVAAGTGVMVVRKHSAQGQDGMAFSDLYGAATWTWGFHGFYSLFS